MSEPRRTAPHQTNPMNHGPHTFNGIVELFHMRLFYCLGKQIDEAFDFQSHNYDSFFATQYLSKRIAENSDPMRSFSLRELNFSP